MTTLFSDLGLNPEIVHALTDLGFDAPTPVQAQAIPAFLQGRDLIVSSQTGSGKTAAFMLPALHRICELPIPEGLEALRASLPKGFDRGGSQRGRSRASTPHRKGGRIQSEDNSALKRSRGPARPYVLVLTPTRELAQQVTQATTEFGKYLRHIEVTTILGGMPYPKQLAMLARMPDILVATPGRLLDHIGAGRIDLSALSMLVFDEADRMLDMGFEEDIDSILAATPNTRQTLMFSATFDEQVAQLGKRMLKNPERIIIKAAQQDQSHIEQRVHFADDLHHKQKLLDHVLRDAQLKQAIVFTATKRDADGLAQDLADNGYVVGALHGDMNQGARNRTLNALRRGDIQVLVATDVAARGIDVPDISHVVNFDLPKQAEDYVHRIGRTGRAGRLGIAINLVNHAEASNWRRIEHYIKRQVQASEIEGLEPRRKPQPQARRGSERPRTASGRGTFAAYGRPRSSSEGSSFSFRPSGEGRKLTPRAGSADVGPAGFGERSVKGVKSTGRSNGADYSATRGGQGRGWR